MQSSDIILNLDASRYLLVKMALRTHKWHRLLGNGLCLAKYAKEVGDGSGDACIRAALSQISGEVTLGRTPWMVEDLSDDQWANLLTAERLNAATLFPPPGPTQITQRLENTPTRRKSRLARRKPRVSVPVPAGVEIIDLTSDVEDEDITPMVVDEPTATSSDVEMEIKQGNSISGQDQPIASSSTVHPLPPTDTGSSSSDIKTEDTEQALPQAVVAAAPTAYPIPPISSPPNVVPPKSENALSSLPNACFSFGTVTIHASLRDLLEMLSGTELRQLARDNKLRVSGNVSQSFNSSQLCLYGDV
jgi:hypothetical protein